MIFGGRQTTALDAIQDEPAHTEIIGNIIRTILLTITILNYY
jgi:hypothetical protein